MSGTRISDKSRWRTYSSTRVDVDRSLGMATFAKAKVDCVLLQSRLKWGTVGDKKPLDSGLLYLKIQFWQPKDCLLHFVEAKVEFGSGKPTEIPCGLNILASEPEKVCGQPWHEVVEKSLEVNPHVEVAGFAGDLGGYSRAQSSENLYRWNFTLQKHPNENGEYTKLAWRWEEQEKGSAVPFERPILAAVAVSHDKSEFTIRTKLKGKLSSLRHGWKHLMIAPINRFAVNLTPDLSATPEDLTEIVEGLQKDMEEENKRQTPIELLDFRQVV